MSQQLEKMSSEEVKRVQIGILDYVDQYCREHGIKYWIDYGTLLGAVRHGGYIPWDDDIDISMLRSDYEKFKQSFNASGEQRYQFICVDNYPAFHNIIGKVLDTNTVLYEPAVNGVKLAVNIDISILDNAPDNDRAIKNIYNKYNLYRYFHHVQSGLYSSRLSRVKLAVSKVLHLLFKLLPENYFVKKQIKSMSRYANTDTDKVANFTQRKWWVYNKSAFTSTVPIEFEGKTYTAPSDYKGWLRTCYGDYMTLPPVEERITHHDYAAYKVVE